MEIFQTPLPIGRNGEDVYRRGRPYQPLYRVDCRMLQASRSVSQLHAQAHIITSMIPFNHLAKEFSSLDLFGIIERLFRQIYI